jgi:uncharacterized protein YuzE
MAYPGETRAIAGSVGAHVPGGDSRPDLRYEAGVGVGSGVPVDSHLPAADEGTQSCRRGFGLGPVQGMLECPMRINYDSEANATYLAVEEDIPNGSATENVVVERVGRGDIVLDFGADGRLQGVEVISARELLGAAVLMTADEA